MTAWASMRIFTIGFLVVAVVVLHHETLGSMVRSWAGNTTYNHGFAIPFIAAFFAWQNREAARGQPAGVWWPGIVFVAGLTGLWTVAALINVQVVAQLASVTLFGAIVLSLAGPAQARVFALPLGYLLFAVPFGEGLVPLLMDWTADFTVAALHVTGIPVIREGLYFSIPSGNFEVAKACSGVRYLLASAAIGVAFAFYTYAGWKKRLLFILASLVVPVIANGFRAFGIVLIAHYSDMRLATGIDHFIYGWVFFGVIILALFLVGARFADADHTHGRLVEEGSGGAAPGRSDSDRQLIGVGTLVLLLIAAGPALVQYRSQAVETPRPALPESEAIGKRWSGPLATRLDWQLDFKGAHSEIVGAYESATGRIEVRVAAYGDQEQGAELINSQNQIAENEDWRVVALGSRATPSRAVPYVRQVRMTEGVRSVLVWYWYQQGRETTVSNYRAKWLETLAIVEPTPAIVVAIAAPGPDDAAQKVLADFLAASGEVLRDCVAESSESGTCAIPEFAGSDR